MNPERVAPPVGFGNETKPWRGYLARKPWEYAVTAIIVHRDSFDALEAVCHLLRHQSEPPYIVVVDTGSDERTLEMLDRHERNHEDFEVHLIRSRGWLGTSHPVAAAMDVGFSLCRTKYAYSTHTDVFLTRPDYLEWLKSLCDESTPVVGYQMSPRDRWTTDDWSRTPSHTATMYYMPWHRRNGVNWNYHYAVEHYKATQREIEYQCAPDTESAPGLWYDRLGLTPRWLTDPLPDFSDGPSMLFIGEEPNEPYSRASLVHVRSAYSTGFYGRGSEEAARRAEDLKTQINKAWSRPYAWRAEKNPTPLWDLVDTAKRCPHRRFWEAGSGHCHRFDCDVSFDPDCIGCPLIKHICTTPRAEF